MPPFSFTEQKQQQHAPGETKENPRQSSSFSDALPFTDREEEFKALQAQLDRTLRGAGNLVFISGEAGIGKTRLAQEFSREAQRAGFRCLSSKCMNAEGLPYAPWIGFLRQFSEQASAQLFFKVCGTNIDHIVRLVPELFESTRAVSISQASQSGRSAEEIQSDEGRFFLALTQVFFKMAETSPLLLIIDDMQWCDAASLRVVGSLLASNLKGSRILLLFLYRNTVDDFSPAFSHFIANLSPEWKESPRLHLFRFNQENVTDLLERTFAPDKTSGMENLERALYSRTGGNLLFIHELLNSLVEQQIIFRGKGGEWTFPEIGEKLVLPETIRKVIKQRLERLDIRSIEALKIASVIGEQFSLEILRKVGSSLESNQDLAPENFELALRSGLIFEIPSHTQPHFQFSDESVRDVLYDLIDLNDRGRLHSIVAKTLEKEYLTLGERSSREHASELANQFLKGGDMEKARGYFEKAGDRAAELYAHIVACAHFRKALEIFESQPGMEKDSLLHAKLLENLGTESQFVPDYETVLTCLTKAADLYEKCGEKGKAAHLLGNIGLMYHLVMYDIPKSRAVLGRGLLLARADSKAKHKTTMEFAQIVSYNVLPDIWTAETVAIREKIDLAMKLASEAGAYDVIAMSSCYAISADPAADVERSIEKCNEGLKVALDHNLVWEASYCYYHRAVAHTYTYGASKKALDLFLEGLDFTARKGYFMVNFFHKVSLLCDVYLPLGEVKKAREMAEEVLKSVAFFPENSLFRIGAEVAMGHVLLYEGQDLPRAERYLTHVYQVTRGYGHLQLDVPLYTALARIAMERNDSERAQSLLKEGFALSRKRGLVVTNAVPHIALLGLMIEFYASSKDENRNEELLLDEILRELHQASEKIHAEWPLAYCFRAEGLVLAKRKDMDRAVSSLQRSIEIFDRLGWAFEVARTQYQLGITLLQRGNLLSAAKSLSAALESFSKLGGAKNEIEKIRALNEKVEEQGIPIFDNQQRFESKEAELVFETLASEFVQDFFFKKLEIEKCGWRSLSGLSKGLNLSKYAMYGRSAGTTGQIFKELLSSGLVEARTFAGERGRGGEVTRIRMKYDRTALKKQTTR